MCNLASIAVNMFVNPDRTYDFQKLKEVTKTVTRNLNKVIDINFYPIEEVCTHVYLISTLCSVEMLDLTKN